MGSTARGTGSSLSALCPFNRSHGTVQTSHANARYHRTNLERCEGIAFGQIERATAVVVRGGHRGKPRRLPEAIHEPLAFGPPMLSKFREQISCSISVDVSCGHRLLVQFTNGDLVSQLPDGAELYRCTMLGPHDLDEYATGESIFSSGNAPHLRLYHHTSSGTKQKIERSEELWGSKWNIQGTHKKLKNVTYVHFRS